MNRKLFLYAIILILTVACKHNSVKISGTIINPVNGEYIILDELKSNQLKAIDSARIGTDGTFRFSRELKQPAFYLLKTNNNNFLTMLLEPGEEVTLKLQNDTLNLPLSLQGSKGTESMVEYNKTLHNTIKKLTGLNKIYEQNTDKPELPIVVQTLDSLANIYLNEINLFTKKYIEENITSLVSLVALYQQVAPGVYVMNPSKDLSYFLKVDSSMFKLYPDYEPVGTLHEQVKELSAKLNAESGPSAESSSGVVAPDIALPTPAGDTIKLSSTKGTITLLDFWASWCSPCRKENPNLVNVYNIYHKKGFQIYQVSLDKTKEAWEKGIQDDHLEKWIHVSDLKYWNSIVVPLYKVESIPRNFLLDKEGRIIASNLRGEQLQKKLAEIFK